MPTLDYLIESWSCWHFVIDEHSYWVTLLIGRKLIRWLGVTHTHTTHTHTHTHTLQQYVKRQTAGQLTWHDCILDRAAQFHDILHSPEWQSKFATKLSSTVHFISAQMAPWRMSSDGLLQTRQRTFGFHKMQTISTLTERLLASQRGLCLLLLLLLLTANWVVTRWQ